MGLSKECREREKTRVNLQHKRAIYKHTAHTLKIDIDTIVHIIKCVDHHLHREWKWLAAVTCHWLHQLLTVDVSKSTQNLKTCTIRTSMVREEKHLLHIPMPNSNLVVANVRVFWTAPSRHTCQILFACQLKNLNPANLEADGNLSLTAKEHDRKM
jgi:hypothetical protein